MTAKSEAIANANAHLNNAGLPTYDELMTMLEKLCDRSVSAGTDSCEQVMVKMRGALIDEARAMVAKTADQHQPAS